MSLPRNVISWAMITIFFRRSYEVVTLKFLDRHPGNKLMNCVRCFDDIEKVKILTPHE